MSRRSRREKDANSSSTKLTKSNPYIHKSTFLVFWEIFPVYANKYAHELHEEKNEQEGKSIKRVGGIQIQKQYVHVKLEECLFH